MNSIDVLEPGSDDFLPTVLLRTIQTAYRKGLLSDLLKSNLLSTSSVLLQEGFHIGMISELVSKNHPDCLATVDEQREMTYQQFNNEANAVANFLQGRFHVDSTSNVLVMMENRSEYLAAWMGVSRLRASTVHTSYRLKPDELNYQVQHSQGQIIFVSQNSLECAREVQNEIDEIDIKLVNVDEHGDGTDVFDYQKLCKNASESYPESTNQDKSSDNIVYTSGTTGRPKAASRELMSPDTWSEQIKMLSELTGLLGKIPINVKDRQLIVTPIYHSAGQAFSVLQMLFAGTVYLRPKFEAEDTIRKLSEWQINNTFLVPTLIRRICDLKDEILSDNPCPELNGIITSAAPFPQTLREEAIDVFGPGKIHELYGATELGLITYIDGHGMLERPNSVGKPLPGQEIKIMGEDGNELETNEVGEIYVRNEETMEEYIDNPEATDEIIADGWMTCEDLGYRDEDGYLYLTGRARDMVITGGVNVYPVEIEETLESHDDVHEAAVTGVDHEEWGEMLICYLVPKQDDFSLEDIELYAEDHLHRAKVPKEWFTIQELPRTDTGKVLKRKLEERYHNSIDT